MKKQLTPQEEEGIQRIAKLMSEMTFIEIEKARNKNIALGFIIGLLVSTIVQLIING